MVRGYWICDFKGGQACFTGPEAARRAMDGELEGLERA